MLLKMFALLWMFPAVIFSQDTTQETKAVYEITEVLRQWPKDFNAKNSQAACQLFAPNLVASYPDSKDRNYDEMCRTLMSAMNSEKIFRYDEPKIEQIIVKDDMAAVRLIWTLQIFNKNQTLLETVQEKGLDIFRRQEDGRWKIVVSHAYPLKN